MKKEVWKIADEIYPEMLDFCKRIVKPRQYQVTKGM